MKRFFKLLATALVVILLAWFLDTTGIFSQVANQFKIAENLDEHNPQLRTLSDQTDTIVGFQVKPILLLPADAPDNLDDTNGLITGFLNRGIAATRAGMGESFSIDMSIDGFDIQFMRSRLTIDQFENTPVSPLSVLIDSGLLNEPGLNRKDFVFFIPANHFNGGEECGIATENYPAAIVAYGRDCGDQAGITWVHELFHTLGVTEHTTDGCDIMNTTGGCGSNFPPIDPNHEYYLGTDALGVDLLKLRVWQGATSLDTGLQANCIVLQAAKLSYATCPTGTQQIGNFKTCWSKIYTAELQQYQGKKWVKVASGKRSSKPWGADLGFSCSNKTVSPIAKLTVTEAGKVTYRWKVNGETMPKFSIYWQN